MITTEMPSSSCLTRRSVSSPSIPCMRRSTRARSTGVRSRTLSPSSPLPALSTSKPSWDSAMLSHSRMLCSSSTISRRSATSGLDVREQDHEAGTAAAGGLDPDLALVLLDDPVHDGQPQAGPVGLGGEEGLEDVGQVLGGDAGTGVLHDDLDQGALLLPRGRCQPCHHPEIAPL